MRKYPAVLKRQVQGKMGTGARLHKIDKLTKSKRECYGEYDYNHAFCLGTCRFRDDCLLVSEKVE